MLVLRIHRAGQLWAADEFPVSELSVSATHDGIGRCLEMYWLPGGEIRSLEVLLDREHFQRRSFGRSCGEDACDHDPRRHPEVLWRGDAFFVDGDRYDVVLVPVLAGPPRSDGEPRTAHVIHDGTAVFDAPTDGDGGVFDADLRSASNDSAPQAVFTNLGPPVFKNPKPGQHPYIRV